MNCKNHENIGVTHFCAICGNAYCNTCLVNAGGTIMCKECHTRLSVQSNNNAMGTINNVVNNMQHSIEQSGVINGKKTIEVPNIDTGKLVDIMVSKPNRLFAILAIVQIIVLNITSGSIMFNSDVLGMFSYIKYLDFGEIMQLFIPLAVQSIGTIALIILAISDMKNFLKLSLNLRKFLPIAIVVFVAFVKCLCLIGTYATFGTVMHTFFISTILPLLLPVVLIYLAACASEGK